MTYNHQLDFDLTKAIIDREDSRVTSHDRSPTKRKKFDFRLEQRGYSQA